MAKAVRLRKVEGVGSSQVGVGGGMVYFGLGEVWLQPEFLMGGGCVC